MVGIHNFNHPMPKACFLCINHLTTHQEKLQHKPTCIHVLARVYEPQTTTTTIFRAYILHQSLKLLQTSKTRYSPSNVFKLLTLASRTMSPVPRSNPCNWVDHQQHFNCNFRHFSKTPNWTRSIDDLSCSLSLETSQRWTSPEYIRMNLHCTRIIRAHPRAPSVCTLNFGCLQSCRINVNEGNRHYNSTMAELSEISARKAHGAWQDDIIVNWTSLIDSAAFTRLLLSQDQRLLLRVGFTRTRFSHKRVGCCCYASTSPVLVSLKGILKLTTFSYSLSSSRK